MPMMSQQQQRLYWLILCPVRRRFKFKKEKPMAEFTHFDSDGNAHMVDVGSKADTKRIAVVKGHIRMQPETLTMITDGTAKKGDVLGVARLAGIMGAKQTANLIPLCHPLGLDHVTLDLAPDHELPGIQITATCAVSGPTGVEMEALTGVSATCLTIYDMCKSISKEIIIKEVKLIEKTGGKSDLNNG